MDGDLRAMYMLIQYYTYGSSVTLKSVSCGNNASTSWCDPVVHQIVLRATEHCAETSH
ncbi:hypothetical protein MY3296_003166 [Beauveria thailandica]